MDAVVSHNPPVHPPLGNVQVNGVVSQGEAGGCPGGTGQGERALCTNLSRPVTAAGSAAQQGQGAGGGYRSRYSTHAVWASH